MWLTRSMQVGGALIAMAVAFCVFPFAVWLSGGAVGPALKIPLVALPVAAFAIAALALPGAADPRQALVRLGVVIALLGAWLGVYAGAVGS